MSSFVNRLKSWLWLTLLFAVMAAGGWLGAISCAHAKQPQAAPEPQAPIVLPVKVVEGRLYTVAEIFSVFEPGKSQTVSLQISFEEPATLCLTESTYRFIGIDGTQAARGDSVFVPVVLGQQKIAVPAREVRADQRRGLLSEYKIGESGMSARYHMDKLEDRPVRGVLGVHFWKKYRVQLNLARNEIVLYPPENETPPTGEVVRSFEMGQGRVLISLDDAGGKTASLMLSTDAYDSWVDAPSAQALGKPAGDVSPVLLSARGAPAVDLSRYLAFRPKRLREDDDPYNDSAMFVSGLNLLQAFRVEIDWQRSLIAFTANGDPHYPRSDFEYFQAELLPGADGLQEWLARHPREARSYEVARALLQRRERVPASTNVQFLQAVQWISDTAPEGRQMEVVSGVLREQLVRIPGRSALVAQAGAMALKHSRGSVNAQEAYRIHAMVGEALMQEGELANAWTHLICAAFMPLSNQNPVSFEHNVRVNMDLARLYERMGRPARAYSRYRKVEDMLRLEDWYTLDGEHYLLTVVEKEMSIRNNQAIQYRVLYDASEEVKAGLQRLKADVPPELLEMLGG